MIVVVVVIVIAIGGGEQSVEASRANRSLRLVIAARRLYDVVVIRSDISVSVNRLQETRVFRETFFYLVRVIFI